MVRGALRRGEDLALQAVHEVEALALLFVVVGAAEAVVLIGFANARGVGVLLLGRLGRETSVASRWQVLLKLGSLLVVQRYAVLGLGGILAGDVAALLLDFAASILLPVRMGWDVAGGPRGVAAATPRARLLCVFPTRLRYVDARCEGLAVVLPPCVIVGVLHHAIGAGSELGLLAWGAFSAPVDF